VFLERKIINNEIKINKRVSDLYFMEKNIIIIKVICLHSEDSVKVLFCCVESSFARMWGETLRCVLHRSNFEKGMR